jgi:hypothetical protein
VREYTYLENDWFSDDVPFSWGLQGQLPSQSTICPTLVRWYRFWSSTWATFQLWAQLHIRNLSQTDFTRDVHNNSIESHNADPVGAKFGEDSLWRIFLILSFLILAFSIHELTI